MPGGPRPRYLWDLAYVVALLALTVWFLRYLWIEFQWLQIDMD